MKLVLSAGLVLAVAVATAAPSVTSAKGNGGGSSYAPGTGSKSSSTHVKAHVRKDGTYVEGHRRSTPDPKFENNWTTKGNGNAYTGKDGTRTTEPAKK
jgi:hypothetical protein